MSTVLGSNLASQRTPDMISQCLCGFFPVASQSSSVHISLTGVCLVMDGVQAASGLGGRITPKAHDYVIWAQSGIQPCSVGGS